MSTAVTDGPRGTLACNAAVPVPRLCTRRFSVGGRRTTRRNMRAGLALVVVACGVTVALLRASSLLFSGSPGQADDWTTYLGNNGRTGYNPHETAITRQSAHRLVLH